MHISSVFHTQARTQSDRGGLLLEHILKADNNVNFEHAAKFMLEVCVFLSSDINQSILLSILMI